MDEGREKLHDSLGHTITEGIMSKEGLRTNKIEFLKLLQIAKTMRLQLPFILELGRHSRGSTGECFERFLSSSELNTNRASKTTALPRTAVATRTNKLDGRVHRLG